MGPQPECIKPGLLRTLLLFLQQDVVLQFLRTLHKCSQAEPVRQRSRGRRHLLIVNCYDGMTPKKVIVLNTRPFTHTHILYNQLHGWPSGHDHHFWTCPTTGPCIHPCLHPCRCPCLHPCHQPRSGGGIPPRHACLINAAHHVALHAVPCQLLLADLPAHHQQTECTCFKQSGQGAAECDGVCCVYKSALLAALSSTRYCNHCVLIICRGLLARCVLDWLKPWTSCIGTPGQAP